MRIGRLCSIVVLVVAACCLLVRGQSACCRRARGCAFPAGCHCPLKMTFCGDPSRGLQIVGKKSDLSYTGGYTTTNQHRPAYGYQPDERDYVTTERFSKSRSRSALIQRNKPELSDILRALQRGKTHPWNSGHSTS